MVNGVQLRGSYATNPIKHLKILMIKEKDSQFVLKRTKLANIQ